MAWYENYERDVLGLPGAARYQRTPASQTSHETDSGISAPAAHIPPVEPPPARRRDLAVDLAVAFVEGIQHFFGVRR